MLYVPLEPQVDNMANEHVLKLTTVKHRIL